MLLFEIKSEDTGTFVGVKFSKESQEDLMNAIEELAVPNPIDKKDLHVTVNYSRKTLQNFDARGKLKEPIEAKAKHFSIFQTQSGNNCLVLELDCPELTKRHKEIRKLHGATHDYPSYKCHVTLSYDVDDYDPSKRKMPKAIKKLVIDHEYTEKLNNDWV